jgi:uncharacterized membrane protein YqhA
MTSNTATTFIHNVSRVIINPLIVLMFAVALLVFLYGVFEYVWKADDEGARETGKRNIIYGIIGIFIMTSAFVIVNFIANSVGADTTSLQGVMQ